VIVKVRPVEAVNAEMIETNDETTMIMKKTESEESMSEVREAKESLVMNGTNHQMQKHHLDLNNNLILQLKLYMLFCPIV
jgi:hypothetical protein